MYKRQITFDARDDDAREDEDEDEDEDPREEWMNDSAKDLWLPVRGRGREAKTEVEVRDEHEHEDARASDSASPRGILTPTGSLRNNGKRTVRFESSLPHGFPERKPSLVKACCSRGRALARAGARAPAPVPVPPGPPARARAPRGSRGGALAEGLSQRGSCRGV